MDLNYLLSIDVNDFALESLGSNLQLNMKNVFSVCQSAHSQHARR